jgi:ribonuclease P protein component
VILLLISQKHNIVQFTFSKTSRILNRKDFIRLFETGKRFKNRYFTALFSPGISGNGRLGLTVSKKIGNAVSRNRIKRYVREYYRLNKYKFKYNWDINIIAGSGTGSLKSDQIVSSLRDVFNKIEEGFDNK